MDSTCRVKTVQSLVKDIEKERILLSHKLQRKEGQWNKQQKSYLIDSLLRKYPINPIYSIKDGDILSVIDGVQRLSTIRDYFNGKFTLSKTLETVVVNGAEKVISGKKYDDLDEETQDALKGSELQIYELVNCTEKDVREIFRRQNSGKALTNGQLRVVKESDELSDVIYSLTLHPFLQKTLTDAQNKRAADKDIVREILMLTEMSAEYDFGSFRSRDIDTFIEYYNDNINHDKIELVKTALDKLDESFDDNVKIKQTTLPFVCYGMYRIIKDKKSTSKYLEWVHNFLDTYESNEEYLKYCQSGSSSAEMVKGRLNYFREAIRKM